MKVLTISFYKDFARYFYYVQQVAAKRCDQVEFDNFVLYPCARHYFSTKGVNSTLLPDCISAVEHVGDNYRGYNLDNLIGYSLKTFKNAPSELKQYFASRAAGYVDYFEGLFSMNRYEYVVCAGDTRIPVEVCAAVAKRNGVKVWYFEQGPFGTTIIDHMGVNANVSFNGVNGGRSGCGGSFDIAAFLQNIKQKGGGKYWLAEKRTVMDHLANLRTLLTMHPPKILSRYYPLELSDGTYASKFVFQLVKERFLRRNSQNSGTIANGSAVPYVALLLQVPHDAQMLLHSPSYDDVVEMVKDVLASLPSGYRLIIREHPLHKGRYSQNLYSIVSSSNVCQIDNASPLSALIDQSAVVVVNNSTTGLDAMIRFKTVVVLGNAYYANDKVTYPVKPGDQLKEKLLAAIEHPIPTSEIKDYLMWLLSDVLIAGHFQDLYLHNADVIIDKVARTS